MTDPPKASGEGEGETATCLCDRCGVPCQVRQPGSPDARLLKRSSVPSGLCAGCAATMFLKGVSPLDTIIDAKGPEALLIPAVRAQFQAVLTAGHADAAPDELDWHLIVENWHLPYKVQRVMG